MLVVGGFFSHTFRKTKSNLPDWNAAKWVTTCKY
jgi:hypothetical protein